MGSDRPRGRFRGWRGVALTLAAVAGGAVVEPQRAAAAETAYVRSSAEFQAAVDRFRWSGGRIVLRGARYDLLTVGPRGSARLTIRGTRNASVGLIQLNSARNVTIVQVRMTPRGAPAGVSGSYVRNVKLDRVVVTGGTTGIRANVVLLDSYGITIRKSLFSRCGDLVVCYLTGRSSMIRILKNRFRDCYGCDFVRGNFGHDLVIRDNQFDRSLVGPCGTDNARCNHQEMIELHKGRYLTIERNRFGVYEPPGAGQIALFGPVNDVRIRNNLFLRTDRRAPGLVARVGINLGGHGRHPKRVVIAHNTILSGRAHWRGFANSIRLKPTYAFMEEDDRPVIANNIIRLANTPYYFCRGARLTAGNLVERGEPCSKDDLLGPANLNALGRPTAASVNVIGRGVPRWKTRFDMRRIPRDADPDAGAFEYVALTGR